MKPRLVRPVPVLQRLERACGELAASELRPLAVLLGWLVVSACTVAGEAPGTASPQGRGHVSPLDGRTVGDLEGLVVATDGRRLSPGFWVALADDADPQTSDGLRVDAAAGAVLPEPGDRLTLSGRIREIPWRDGELTVTRLVDARWVVSGRGPLPRPVGLGRYGSPWPLVVDDDGLESFDPSADALDLLESLEGMRVEIEDARVVGATTRFGEVFVAPPGVAPDGGTRRGGLLASDDTRAHACRVVVDPASFRMPRVHVGDRFAGPLVGVVDYGFGNYRVVLTEPPPDFSRPDLRRDRTTLRGDEDHLTVATYNVLNLGGDDAERTFRELAESVVGDLGAPDVLALQEIQDASGETDDGVVVAAPVLERLSQAIAHAGGPRYDFAQVDPGDNEDGGAPGANIRVCFLYDPTRVEIVSLRRLLASAPAFRASRKPLLAEIAFGDRTVFAINNHLSSKRADDPLYGGRQPPERHSEPTRLRQARGIAAEVETLRRRRPDAAVIVLGDFNEHEFRPPLEVLEEVGLENLLLRLPAADRYTYNFEGVSQALDHVLVSAPLASGAEIDIVHVNADFAADGRISDHDPVVVRLALD